MNILILTGKFGMGHLACAQSLGQQMERSFPSAAVTIEDFPAYAMPKLSRPMYRGFEVLVRYGSGVFNLYYELTRHGGTDNSPPLEGFLMDRLIELLDAHRPDVVVATHPLCAQLMTRLKREEGLDLPVITCVTDVTDHPEWINRGTDCYLVPSREVKGRLCQRGVPAQQVLVTGIPVGERFHTLSRHDRGDCRRLLVMGGGLGLLPRQERFYQQLDSLPNVQTTVITGRNEKLYGRLFGRYPNIQVVGYTDRVPAYMAQADLMVTKPGGITLFECIFAQLPMLVWPPQLQQEKYNARWLAQKEIGWIAGEMDCVADISGILFDDGKLDRAMAAMGEMKEQLEAESLRGMLRSIEKTGEVSA